MESTFDELEWHDCYLWGIQFLVGEPDKDDWTSGLLLDIDYIVAIECYPDGSPTKWRLAPATLTFNEVTDPHVNIDWHGNTFQNAIHHVCIDRITRKRIKDQKVHFDRKYYRWTIETNFPETGKITFGAVDFSLVLLAEPVLSQRQHLTLRERNRLLGREIK